MPQIKIAFCIPNMILGGVENVFVQTLTDISSQENVKIKVIMQTKLSEPLYQEWFKRNENIEVVILYPLGNAFENLKRFMPFFPLSNIRKIIYSLYKKIKNRSAINKGLFSDCDLIIDYKNFSFYKILKLIQKPKITWVHGSINFFNENNFKKRLPYYDKVVCLTKSFMKDFKKQNPEFSQKIVQIYNPLNSDNIKKLSEQNQNIKDKYFCAVSRLDYDKDIITIIKAFNDFWITENKPDVKLVLIGDGKQYKELKQVSTSMEAKNQIIFTGALNIPFGYMKGSLAHILSSYDEGMGMVILESCACGTLNLASNCKNGPAEILMNGKAGLLFKPGDTKELSNMMRLVWHEKIPREKLIQNATSGLKRFSCEKISKDIFNLIKQTTKTM